MNVVGRDESKSEVVGDGDEARPVSPLLLDAVVGQFDEEVLCSKDVAVGGGMIPREIGLTVGQSRVDLAFEASAQGDEPLGMGGEEFPVHAGLVIEALEVGGRGDLDEVAVALVVRCEEGQVMGRILASMC